MGGVLLRLDKCGSHALQARFLQLGQVQNGIAGGRLDARVGVPNLQWYCRLSSLLTHEKEFSHLEHCHQSTDFKLRWGLNAQDC